MATIPPNLLQTAQDAIAQRLPRAAKVKSYSVPGQSVQNHSITEMIQGLTQLDELRAVQAAGTRVTKLEIGDASW